MAMGTNIGWLGWPVMLAAVRIVCSWKLVLKGSHWTTFFLCANAQERYSLKILCRPEQIAELSKVHG